MILCNSFVFDCNYSIDDHEIDCLHYLFCFLFWQTVRWRWTLEYQNTCRFYRKSFRACWYETHIILNVYSELLITYMLDRIEANGRELNLRNATISALPKKYSPIYYYIIYVESFDNNPFIFPSFLESGNVIYKWESHTSVHGKQSRRSKLFFREWQHLIGLKR